MRKWWPERTLCARRPPAWLPLMAATMEQPSRVVVWVSRPWNVSDHATRTWSSDPPRRLNVRAVGMHRRRVRAGAADVHTGSETERLHVNAQPSGSREQSELHAVSLMALKGRERQLRPALFLHRRRSEVHLRNFVRSGASGVLTSPGRSNYRVSSRQRRGSAACRTKTTFTLR